MILEYQTTGINQTITLPLYQTVNVVVYWDDENRDSYNIFGDKDHTYVKAGTYQVKIYGILHQFGHTSTPYANADKLIRVISFGELTMSDLSGAFYGSTNLIEVPATLPTTLTHIDYIFYGATAINDPNISDWNVSNITRMEFAFYAATSFNQPLTSWNVSNVTNMNSMFSGAIAFDQSLSSWNISNVQNFNNFLENATLSIQNYDALLSGWSELPTLYNLITFNAGNSKYSYGTIATIRQSIIDNYTWTILDGGNRPLITTPLTLVYQITIPTQTIELPLYESVDVDIDWGDTFLDSYYETGIQSHTYSSPGTYQVKIYNYLEKFGIEINPNQTITPVNNIDRLVAVLDFGDIGLKSLSGAFLGASNLTQVPATLPATITDLSYLFFKASKINDANISGWDISNINDFSYMFFNATAFTQSITSWNIPIIFDGDLSYMLYGSSTELPSWLLIRLTTL